MNVNLMNSPQKLNGMGYFLWYLNKRRKTWFYVNNLKTYMQTNSEIVLIGNLCNGDGLF
jgi:hypothetical protein